MADHAVSSELSAISKVYFRGRHSQFRDELWVVARGCNSTTSGWRARRKLRMEFVVLRRRRGRRHHLQVLADARLKNCEFLVERVTQFYWFIDIFS